MLQIHNSKVSKILTSFREKFESRQAAKNDVGDSTMQVWDEDDCENTIPSINTSTSFVVESEDLQQPKPKTLKKKKTLKVKPKKIQELGIEIKVKGIDGSVISY